MSLTRPESWQRYYITRENKKGKKEKDTFTREIQFTLGSVATRDQFGAGPVINPPPNAIANCWVNEGSSSREMSGESSKVLIICKLLAAGHAMLRLRE